MNKVNEIWIYCKKKFMSHNEKKFYNNICAVLDDEYIVIPQINLASIIRKKHDSRYCKWQNELFKNVDFGVFLKDTFELLILIEINDSSHKKYRRQLRDNKVEMLCDIAGYDNFIKFFSYDYNNIELIKEKISEQLNIINNKKKLQKTESK